MSKHPDTPRRRARVAVAAVTITLAAATAWWVVDGDERSMAKDVSVAAPDFGWRLADRRTYDLTHDVLVDSGIGNNGAAQNAAGTASASETRLRAQLCVHVLSADARTARVAMQLRGVQRESGGTRDERREAALGLPFVVEFDGGMPLQFEFPAALDDEARSELAELVRTFQVTLPPQSARRWSVLEEHEAGRYRAAYQVLPGGGWHKRKAAYLPGGDSGAKGAAGDPIRVFDSSATLIPASSASWWERAEVHEDVQLSLLGAPFARVRMHALLRARPDGFDLTAELARAGEAAELMRVSLPSRDGAVGAAATRIAGPEERARFFAVVAAWIDGGGKDFNAVHSLAAMLKEFPELALELLPRLADGSIAGAASAGLVHAMELAGNESCQDVLGEVCSEVSYPQANRKRAIIGLGGVKEPTEASVATLWKLSAGRDPDGGNDLASSALLALGIVGRNLREGHAKRSADLSLGLETMLASAGPRGRALVLTAIYNTHDATLLPAVQDELDSPDPMVRAAAAMAASTMDRPEAFDSLFRRVSSERDSWARVALIDGMGRLSHKSEEAFSECADLVRSESDPHVRMSLARYLVDNLDHYPAGRTTLQAIMNDRHASPKLREYLVKNLFRSKSSSRRTFQRG